MGSLTGWLSNLPLKGPLFSAKESRPQARGLDRFAGTEARRSMLPGNGRTNEGSSSKRERDADRFLDVVRPSPGKAERIVIYRLGSLGDTVVALPCFHKIAAVFPHAERLVLTNIPVSTKAAPLPSILANSGLIHGYLTYPVGERSLTRLWNLARQLRRLDASTLVYLPTPRRVVATARDLLFFRLCGFKHIIGLHLSWDQRKLWVDPETGTLEFEAGRLVRLLHALGPIDLDDPAGWDLRLTEGERAAGAAMLAPFEGRPFIAINMGGKKIESHWGDDNWRRLFIDLARTHGAFGLLVVGSVEDAASVETVTAGWPAPVVNACGALTPRETAGALERASLFLGHDSGPMHLAAACGIRCVALFGSHNRPRHWYPYGEGHRVIHDTDGIAGIEVEAVLANVRDVLPEMPPQPMIVADLGSRTGAVN